MKSHKLRCFYGNFPNIFRTSLKQLWRTAVPLKPFRLTTFLKSQLFHRSFSRNIAKTFRPSFLFWIIMNSAREVKCISTCIISFTYSKHLVKLHSSTLGKPPAHTINQSCKTSLGRAQYWIWIWAVIWMYQVVGSSQTSKILQTDRSTVLFYFLSRQICLDLKDKLFLSTMFFE